MTDSQHIQKLAQKWYQRKAWAEQMLVKQLGLHAIREILWRDRAVEKDIPGTDWKYKTHGIGVSVHRLPDQTGGIDFDLDKPDPDFMRLSEFARREVDEGELEQEVYERVFKDWDKLRKAMLQVLPKKFA